MENDRLLLISHTSLLQYRDFFSLYSPNFISYLCLAHNQLHLTVKNERESHVDQFYSKVYTTNT